MTFSAIKKAENLVRFLNMDISCLDATLLSILQSFNFIKVTMDGDGTCIAIQKNGQIVFWDIVFEFGAPYYLSYLIDSKRNKLYFEKFSEYKKITTSDQEVLLSKVENPFEINFDIEDYSCILIASDGLSTFTDSEGNKISLSEVVKEVTAFKNFNGDFIQRRLTRTVKDFEKKGFYHTDDISVAGIYIEE